MTHNMKGKCKRKMDNIFFKNLPCQLYHGFIIYLFVVHFSVCNGHKLLNRRRNNYVDQFREINNNLISDRLENNSSYTGLSSSNASSSAKIFKEVRQGYSLNSIEDIRFRDLLLRNALDHNFTTDGQMILGYNHHHHHSRVARGTNQAWRTKNLGQPFQSAKMHLLSLLDNYMPRSLLLKLANFLASYQEGTNKKKLNLSISERKYFLNVIETLERKLHEVSAKNLSTVVREISISLPDSPKFMRTSFDFLTSRLLRRLAKKHTEIVARQTPFGIVNFFLGFLSDPIVLTLFIALNLWIVFWGVYTVAFGAGFALLPGLGFGGADGFLQILGFGGGGGGGGGGGSGGGGDPPVTSAPVIHVAQIVTATESPPTVTEATEIQPTNASTAECPCVTGSTAETSDETATEALPDSAASPPGFEDYTDTEDQIGLLINYPFLQACLSLGGNKADCVTQAYLYAQILQGPFNISVIEQLFGGSQGSYGSAPGSYDGSHGTYGGSHGSYGGSMGPHGGSYGSSIDGAYEGSSGALDGTTTGSHGGSYAGSPGSLDGSYGSSTGIFSGSTTGTHSGSHGSHVGSHGSHIGGHVTHGKPHLTTENPYYKPSKTSPDSNKLFGGSVFPPHISSPAPPPPSLITFIPPPIDSAESIRPLPPLILGGTTSQTGLVVHNPHHTKAPPLKPYPNPTTPQSYQIIHFPQHSKPPVFKPYLYHSTPAPFKPYTSTMKPFYTSENPYPLVYKPHTTSHAPYPSTIKPSYITYFKPYSTSLKPFTTLKPYHTSSLKPYPPGFKPYQTTLKPALPVVDLFPPLPPVNPPSIAGATSSTSGGKPSLSELIMALHPHAVIVPVNNQIDNHWKENLK